MAATRVLVTGGTGFIGSRLCKRLLRTRVELHLLIHRASVQEALGSLASRVTCHSGDIGDAGSLARCVSAAAPHVVFHLARPAGASFEEQAQATLRVAAVLAENAPGLRRLVRAAHAVSPRLGRSADAALAETVRVRYGIPVVTLEIFQVYGPGQRPDSFPMNLVDSAALGRPVDRLAGGARDFVHVDDVVRGLMAASRRRSALGRTIELGSGSLSSVDSAAKEAARILGITAPTVLPARDVGHAADLRSAREHLGWRPRIRWTEGIAALAARQRERR